MLDVVLALDGSPDVVKPLEIDEPVQSVSFGKAFDETRPMLERAANQIIRHADIKNAVRSIGQNVNVPAACHAEILQDVDGRDKPGHDDDGYILCSHRGMTVCLGKARAAYPAPTAFLRQATGSTSPPSP